MLSPDATNPFWIHKQAARTIFGQYPGGHSMEEKHMISANEMSKRQKGARRITHDVVYGSLFVQFPLPQRFLMVAQSCYTCVSGV